MQIITVNSVGGALPEGLRLLSHYGEAQDSRAGPVIVAPWPVTTHYRHPANCVLQAPLREANPFFHLVESVWMLLGRCDAAFLTPYVKDFDRFAETSGFAKGLIHGAYGARWRWLRDDQDQLAIITDRLMTDPLNRQCVLQMWDNFIYGDLREDWRDRPCNTHVYFLRRNNLFAELEMTVCCRSNDMIMGGYGANAVHFSILQSYMAARIGVTVGAYYQISNNYHVYMADVDRMAERAMRRGKLQANVDTMHWKEKLNALAYLLETEETYLFIPDLIEPVVTSPATFEQLLFKLGDHLDALHASPETVSVNSGWAGGSSELEPWLDDVWRAALAHALYRTGRRGEALIVATGMRCPHWRTACRGWLGRRA
jgi:thymidylate synthase